MGLTDYIIPINAYQLQCVAQGFFHQLCTKQTSGFSAKKCPRVFAIWNSKPRKKYEAFGGGATWRAGGDHEEPKGDFTTFGNMCELYRQLAIKTGHKFIQIIKYTWNPNNAPLGFDYRKALGFLRVQKKTDHPPKIPKGSKIHHIHPWSMGFFEAGLMTWNLFEAGLGEALNFLRDEDKFCCTWSCFSTVARETRDNGRGSWMKFHEICSVICLRRGSNKASMVHHCHSCLQQKLLDDQSRSYLVQWGPDTVQALNVVGGTSAWISIVGSPKNGPGESVVCLDGLIRHDTASCLTQGVDRRWRLGGETHPKIRKLDFCFSELGGHSSGEAWEQKLWEGVPTNECLGWQEKTSHLGDPSWN